MAPQNRSAVSRPGTEEDPATAVPEADAVEQGTSAAEEENGRWLEEPAGGSLDQAGEADLVEQRREAGAADEDEYR
ncbi:hypothetical protein [Nocardiopsis sp. LOL_012]|uniref:hypothetical protein n=1 Tax=Nocardiopsis sp. LOL_012 TaxID=3345409 RepID=UPI003A8AA88B